MPCWRLDRSRQVYTGRQPEVQATLPQSLKHDAMEDDTSGPNCHTCLVFSPASLCQDPGNYLPSTV